MRMECTHRSIGDFIEREIDKQEVTFHLILCATLAMGQVIPLLLQSVRASTCTLHSRYFHPVDDDSGDKQHLTHCTTLWSSFDWLLMKYP